MTAKEANMQRYTKYVEDSNFVDIDFSYFLFFRAPVEKVFTDEEECHGIGIDFVLKLEHLFRSVLSD